jgi:predicted Zn finger-like uncharacterized protein
MPLVFACPSCKRQLQVDDSQSGKPVRCPHCGKVSLVGNAPVLAAPVLVKPSYPVAVPVSESPAVTPRNPPSRCQSKPGLKAKPLPWWILAVSLPAAVGLVLCCGGFGLMTLAVLQQKTGGVVKGHYPAPTHVYNGRTAAEWGEQAKDVNPDVVHAAAWPLHHLGSEGVPYLLEAAHHHGGGTNFTECLGLVDGSLLDDADLSLIASYLDDRYAGSDGNWGFGGGNVRNCALGVLERAGPKAKQFSPQMERVRLALDKLKPR